MSALLPWIIRYQPRLSIRYLEILAKPLMLAQSALPCC